MFIEIGVNELNTLYRSTGLTKDQVYRIINSGNLEPNALTVKFGDFVRWDGSKWVMTATKLATIADVGDMVNESETNAVQFVFDDGDQLVQSIDDLTEEYYNSHVLGNFYIEDGKVYVCTKHEHSGDDYETKLEKVNGMVEALNKLAERVTALGNIETLLAAI